MLAAAVDAGKGLLMQQAHQTVLCRDLLHDLHGQLVVVGGDICCAIDRSKLMLSRRYLVMLCFSVDTKSPELLVKIFHVSLNSCLDSTEIVIFKFLTLWSRCAVKRSACKDKILSLCIHLSVYKEVFLLRTNVCCNSCCV